MNRNIVFDQTFTQLYNQRKTDGFFPIYTWTENELGINDEKMLNDIIEEMLQLNWIEKAEYSKHDICLTYIGIKVFEEFGSYSSYEKLRKSTSKKDQRKKKFKKYTTIGFTLLFGFSTLILGWLKYYNDKTIEHQLTKIDELNIKIITLDKEIDSLTYLLNN